MAWTSFLKDCNRYITTKVNRFSCCDLCGNNVNKTSLLGYSLPQNLLCQNCVDLLPYFKQELITGNLLSWPAIYRSLPNIHFEQLFALSPYGYPLEQWITQLKYLGRFELAQLLSCLLSAQWKSVARDKDTVPIDLVLSVPLHINKWQSRGYNQAHLIAKSLAEQLVLPYNAELLIRIKNNDSQMGKTGSQRRKNLADAFSLKEEIHKSIKHVMLVDDVVTTGTTASEISKLLKKAGVKRVTVVTVCLTLPKD